MLIWKAFWRSFTGTGILMGSLLALSIYKPLVISGFGYLIDIDSGGIEIGKSKWPTSVHVRWRARPWSDWCNIDWKPQKPVGNWNQLKQELGFDFVILKAAEKAHHLSSGFVVWKRFFGVAIWFVWIIAWLIVFSLLILKFRRSLALFQGDQG